MQVPCRLRRYDGAFRQPHGRRRRTAGPDEAPGGLRPTRPNTEESRESRQMGVAHEADPIELLIDNGFVLLVPGAMEAGLGDLRFWLPLLGGFVIAWPFAFIVNRSLLKRGKGHAVVHAYH